MEINGKQYIPNSGFRRVKLNWNCDKHGQFSTMWFVDKDDLPIGEPMCPKCKEEEYAIEREENSILYLQSIIRCELIEADVPEDNLENRFSNFIASTEYMQQKVDICKSFVDRDNTIPSCLCFLGSTGTGKTHLSVSCLASIIIDNIKNNRQDDKLKYTRASELMRDFKSIMNTKKGSTTENQLIREYQTYAFLVIDELARFVQGDYATSIIQEIISYRLETNRKTILILNGTFNDLKTILGEHNISRLIEKGKSLKFDEEDYRKKMQMERKNEESTNAV